MENYKIDIVIPWVDDSDLEWRTEKNKFWELKSGNKASDANNEARFRDWDTLKYVFRGIEKFAPWVNKIYFVTCGHVPEWLNLDNPKLVHITHKDYIPLKYLPVFSANPIEINFHRIPGLCEHFIYFNDDMFLTNAVTPDDFFVNGLPREMSIQYALSNDGTNDTFQHMLLTMAGQINAKFNFQKSIRTNWKKWYSLKYGKYLVHNLLMIKNRNMSGLVIPHVPSALRKSTMEEVWKELYKQMDETSSHKFRDNTDITQYMFRYWEMMKGTFVPTNIFRYSEEFHVTDEEDEKIYDAILNQKYKMICINDNISVSSVDIIMKKVQECFEVILPEKSLFER